MMLPCRRWVRRLDFPLVAPPAARAFTFLTNWALLPNGAFRFSYANGSGQSASVYASSNLVNWAAIGVASQTGPGLFEFTDTGATNFLRRFYQLRTP